MKNTEEKKKVGRPSLYTSRLGQEICDAIASNSHGISRLCRDNPKFPSKDTIFQWIMHHKEFADRYARAKMAQAELMIDEIIEISDNKVLDSTVNDKGDEVPDHEYMQRSRLRVDTRKWLASKLVPKVYGDKIDLNGTITLRHEDALKELE